MSNPKSFAEERDEGARFESIRLTPLHEKLLACVRALSITRGQWIHSVNAKQCLAALEALAKELE